MACFGYVQAHGIHASIVPHLEIAVTRGQVRRWKELADTIMSPEVFMPLSSHEAGFSDLLLYWSSLMDPLQGDTTPVYKCEECVLGATDAAVPEKDQIRLFQSLGDLLQVRERERGSLGEWIHVCCAMYALYGSFYFERLAICSRNFEAHMFFMNGNAQGSLL